MEQEVALNLKHLCRETIRKHLLKLDPHENLFHRVPRLGLPTLISDYLLYNQTLDDEKNDDSDDDSDDNENNSDDDDDDDDDEQEDDDYSYDDQ